MRSVFSIWVICTMALPVVFAAERASGQGVWTERGPDGSQVRLLLLDQGTPDTMYAASGHGLYKTIDAGVSWRRADVGLVDGAIIDLAMDPVVPTTLYAAVLSPPGVYESTDGGAHWSLASGGLGAAAVSALALDPRPPGTIYGAAGADGLFVTRDRGRSWAPVTGLAGERVVQIAIDPANPDAMYAAGADVVFKSVDGGSSWTAVPALASAALVVDPTDGRRVYAAAQGVSVSTDAGATWTPMNDGLLDTSVRGLVATPADPGAVYAVTNGAGVFRLAPGASQWTHVTDGLPSQFTRSVVVKPDSVGTLYVGTIEGVYERLGTAGSWQDRSRGLHTFLSTFAVDPGRPSTLYAGSLWQRELSKSVDGGRTWQVLPTGFRNPVNAIVFDPTSHERVYAVQHAGVFLSEDGGASWHERSEGLPGTSVYALAIAPTRPATMYAGTGRVYRSLDGGVSWVPTSRTPPGISATGRLVVDPTNPDVVYAGSLGLLKTSNGGATWQRQRTGLPSGAFVTPLAVDPTASSTVYVGTSVGPSFKSTDGGVTWGPLTDQHQITSLAIDARDPSTLYAGTTDGAWVSHDGGVTWDRFGQVRSPGMTFMDLALDPHSPGTAYAHAFARGVVRVDTGPRRPVHCYRLARATSVATRLALGNMLDPAFEGVVRRPRRLCAPADGGDDAAAVTDPAALLAYDLRAPGADPSPRELALMNRLGTAHVRVGPPNGILAPAIDAPGGTIARAPAGGLDHFTCYRARGDRTRHTGVSLDDRFGRSIVDLRGPVRLCVPTDVDGGGIADEGALLACYVTRRRTPKVRPGFVTVDDTFGTTLVVPRSSREVCLPSTVAPTP